VCLSSKKMRIHTPGFSGTVNTHISRKR
jgi:hypothetical protein